MKHPLLALAALTLASGFAASAHAGEAYTGIGTHGVMLGYAQALSPDFTLRGDFGTLGSREKQQHEGSIDYQSKATYNRLGLFGDWFPFTNGFRFTGGVTFNNMKLDLAYQGNGNPVTIGNNTYATDSTDRLNVKIEFPKTTPYLGLGFGHQLSTGWGFVFDLGASIGKATVSETHSGNHFSLASQADVDAEMAQVRDGAGKIKAIPLLAIGFIYRF